MHQVQRYDFEGVQFQFQIGAARTAEKNSQCPGYTYLFHRSIPHNGSSDSK
jgi:hypothetical protein